MAGAGGAAASGGAGERGVASSLQEYGRGVAGGLLFSLPLLYTAEVWDTGGSMSPERLLVGVLICFALLLGYNRYAGLHQDASAAEVAIDSVEELGLGLLVAAGALWLLGRIDASMRPDVVVATVLLEGLLAAIGVSVGTAQLGGEEQGGMVGDQGAGDAGGWSLGGEVALSACGAMLIAANIAPTDEVLLLAASIDPWRALGLALLSLLLGGFIRFYSQFVGSVGGDARPQGGRLLGEVLLLYAIALAVAAGLLWFFGRFDGHSLTSCVEQTVVLGVAATLGAAAGKLLLQR